MKYRLFQLAIIGAAVMASPTLAFASKIIGNG